MNFNLDSIKIRLDREGSGVRLKTDIENWYIPNQTVDETSRITTLNFRIVKRHYESRAGQIVLAKDLDGVCFNIVLHYFQMYNHWRTMYKREANRDLTFLEKDFEHPTTSSCIVEYFRKMHPNNFADKCEAILGMEPKEFEEYLAWKESFDKMF